MDLNFIITKKKKEYKNVENNDSGEIWNEKLLEIIYKIYEHFQKEININKQKNELELKINYISFLSIS